jgi:hypothetical protein
MRQGATPPWSPVAAAILSAFLVPAMVSAEDQSLPDSRLGVRTAPLLLLSRAEVRADLALTPEQAPAAEHEIRALHAKAADLKGQKDSEAVAARRQIDDEQQRWLAGNLSTEQRNRLVEIDLQWEGPSALITRPSVAEALKLTAPQRKSLAEAITRRDIERSQGKTRPEDEAELTRQTLALLSAEQKAKWKLMLGRPFTVQTATAPTATRR